MTGNAIFIVFAVINVIVTGIFAGTVLSQYARRHRVYQLYWSLALTMAFLATLAFVFAVVIGPTTASGEGLFRIYYILGGALTSAWLGLGSLALVASARVTRISLVILSVLSVVTVVLIATAGIDMGKLGQIASNAGSGVLKPGAWVIMIAVMNTLGVLAVVGVAVFSGWKLMRRRSSAGSLYTSKFLWANVLIVIGDLFNGVAGGGLRIFGLEGSFWLIMAVGWTVFFMGVLLASRRAAVTRTAGQVQASEVKGGAASV